MRLFRKLADDLESGRLDGGRIQWRRGLDHVVRVELDPALEEDEKRVRQARLETIDLGTGAVVPGEPVAG